MAELDPLEVSDHRGPHAPQPSRGRGSLVGEERSDGLAASRRAGRSPPREHDRHEGRDEQQRVTETLVWGGRRPPSSSKPETERSRGGRRARTPRAATRSTRSPSAEASTDRAIAAWLLAPSGRERGHDERVDRPECDEQQRGRARSRGSGRRARPRRPRGGPGSGGAVHRSRLFASASATTIIATPNVSPAAFVISRLGAARTIAGRALGDRHADLGRPSRQPAGAPRRPGTEASELTVLRRTPRNAGRPCRSGPPAARPRPRSPPAST